MASEGKAPVTNTLAKYKFVFLGDQSVGKTSIINRFIYDTFDGKDHPTVGIDFISKTIYFDDKTIRLQLWDTAGQERFRSLIPSYIRDSSVAVIVYDVTSKGSFLNINKWIEYVREERGDNVIIALVGNKTDTVDKRQVTTEEGVAKAEEYGVLFTEVSAKIGTNVANLFQTLATHLTGSEPNNTSEIPVNAPQQNKGVQIQNTPQTATQTAGSGCGC